MAINNFAARNTIMPERCKNVPTGMKFNIDTYILPENCDYGVDNRVECSSLNNSVCFNFTMMNDFWMNGMVRFCNDITVAYYSCNATDN
jgi:hypothetical protein